MIERKRKIILISSAAIFCFLVLVIGSVAATFFILDINAKQERAERKTERRRERRQEAEGDQRNHSQTSSPFALGQSAQEQAEPLPFASGFYSEDPETGHSAFYYEAAQRIAEFSPEQVITIEHYIEDVWLRVNQIARSYDWAMQRPIERSPQDQFALTMENEAHEFHERCGARNEPYSFHECCIDYVNYMELLAQELWRDVAIGSQSHSQAAYIWWTVVRNRSGTNLIRVRGRWMINPH